VTIEIFAVPQEDHVRLRLGIGQNRQRILRPQHGATSNAPEQHVRQSGDTRRMAAADRRHLDDLPADQLYPVVLIEDSGLGHPVVFVQRESMSRQLDVERHAVILDAAYARASMPIEEVR
jgi:hypothetical protein